MEADHPTIGEYTLTCKLGGGSSSTVWKAEHRTTGKVVALKQIDLLKLTRQLKNCLDCELSFLSSVEHPNIIRLFDVFQAENSIFLVLEFCAGGDLAAYIRDHGRVQECVVRKFMKQIVGAGLEVLSMHHIIHRDLKPENILLSTMETDPIVKIADFGLSRMLNPNDLAETVCGSPFYMAPEILEFKKYDDKVDMWSLGAIFFELLNGYPPFRGRTSVQILRNIKASLRLPFFEPILPQLHPGCVDLCSRLLSIDPEKRISFKEFCGHDFLKIDEGGDKRFC
ncbi:serine/threonine-protein kinase ATG1t isoform X5 [Solanum stenotomum]|uniref:serine/threonine-protein kinase ATG1t isoform X2 n=1 Tax=Solanum stenotomum TaxID=172797 RepID=UPI0020D09F98|nr:serine/threonine-protein kinase ATG1t isoform X2 [Solanum stenotomum]XP_049387992.1 serine/threonine-protein kinase ATG1t isoform X3 [Solanum stenotomum]XP_049387993.1 serine/threonine-protein kinase ATG1t isoform X4 [Solanum stenotomum]XP_049387994.1 serine/threonine-protein kinase ATG1t isoform X5 [Solanum stenotomum]